MKTTVSVILATVLMLLATILPPAVQPAGAASGTPVGLVDWSARADIDYANVDHYRMGLYREVRPATGPYYIDVLGGGWIGIGYIAVWEPPRSFFSGEYLSGFEARAFPSNVPSTTTSYDFTALLDSSSIPATSVVTYNMLLSIVYKDQRHISVAIPILTEMGGAGDGEWVTVWPTDKANPHTGA